MTGTTPRCWKRISANMPLSTTCRYPVRLFHDAVTFLDQYTADYQIVFMDIMMPMLDGMQAARLLRQKDNKVALVFVTTMRQYAVQGYEVDACDFLVKPVTYPEFALKFTRILTKVPQPDTGREVFLKTENSFVRLSSRDILYVESRGTTASTTPPTGNTAATRP